jgi:hypothetical protein
VIFEQVVIHIRVALFSSFGYIQLINIFSPFNFLLK